MDASALVSKSAKLQSSANRSNEEYDRQIRDLIASLRQSLSKNALDFAANDTAILDSFDPATDSITYLLLLRLQTVKALQQTPQEPVPAALRPSGELWSKSVHFLQNFNTVQVRYLGLEWRQVVEQVAEAARAVSKPFLATRLIRDAMLRLDPSCAVFTSTHLLLVRLCLQSKAYTCALPVLDKHICHFPGPSERFSKSSPVLCADHESSLSFITDNSGLSAPLTWRDHARYFLYGGMIYLALKKWSQASHFLELVMSMPTAGPLSMIMVEAYKKWVLVGLLETGKLRQCPGMVTQHVSKSYQAIARPYVNLANAFELGDADRLSAEIEAARHLWVGDKNMGLVSQVQKSFVAHNLAGVKKIFAAMTVAEISNQTSSLPNETEAAESVIASLIMSGAVSATLVHAQGHPGGTMLRFANMADSSQPSHEAQVQVTLAKESRTLESLIGCVRKSNDIIGLGDEFIDHIHKGQAWTGSEDHPQTGEDVGLEMDEDIMGDQS